MSAPDIIQSLVDTLVYERDIRVKNLAHTIKSLRGTVLMLQAMLVKESDEQTYYGLEATQTHVSDILLWLQDILAQEVEKQTGHIKEGEDRTIH